MPDEVRRTETEISELALVETYPENGSSQDRQWYQYPVKVVCGSGNPRGPVAPGRYFTAVNIHNPDSCHSLKFRWKVTVALPGKVGPVSRFAEAMLGPDESIEIDCPELRELSEYDGELLKGFVVIQSPRELDIVAVYTASQKEAGPVQVLDIEKVDHTHRFTPCRPLHLSLNTRAGSGWRVAKLDDPGKHGLQPVIAVNPINVGWRDLPSGVQWVADSASDNDPGHSVYVFRFRLSCCYKDPRLTIRQLVADNRILWARLNANKIPLTGGLVDNFKPTRDPATGEMTTSFRCGWNELRILVGNDGGAAGMALQGEIVAEDGICD